MTIKSLCSLTVGVFASLAMMLPLSSNTLDLVSLNEDATNLEQDVLSVQHHYDLMDFSESIGSINGNKFVVIIGDITDKTTRPEFE